MDKPEIVITLKSTVCADDLVLALEREGYQVHVKKLSAEADIFAFPEDCVTVTDSRSLAEKLSMTGRAVIGFEPTRDFAAGNFFPGTGDVLTSLEGTQASYIDQICRRRKGAPFQVAETNRLSIRESTEDDFEAFYRMEHEEENQGRIFGQVLPEDRESARDTYLSYIHTAYRFYGFGLWTVLDRESGRVIGRCGLSPQADEASPEGRIELGYLIEEDERRKGYGIEACTAILNFAFQDLECEEIFARIHEGNFPSGMFAARLGFKKSRNMEDGTWLWKLTGIQYQGGKRMAQNPIVTITMDNGGVIKAELYPDMAPNTVNNFISLVRKGFYDGLIFHRVIAGFMIQGGDPEGTGMGGPGYCIKGEFRKNHFPQNTLRHTPGVLSMARAMSPNSAGSQFFIMHGDAPYLDGDYAGFGKVTEGMDVVDQIAQTDTDYSDRPMEEQKIRSMTVETFGVEYPEPEKV